EEDVAAADDPGVLEIVGDAPGRTPGLEAHQFFLRRTRRQQQTVSQQSRGGDNHDDENSQQESAHEKKVGAISILSVNALDWASKAQRFTGQHETNGHAPAASNPRAWCS